jgi:hypothetical protein
VAGFEPDPTGRFCPILDMRIEELPPAPACRITVRLPARPAKVVLQPQGTECDNWIWNNGLLQVHVPGFEIHQMVAIQ